MGKQIEQLCAHISEHMAHKYRNEAEKLMGTQNALDIKDGKGLSEEQEQAIAAQAAQAAAEITARNNKLCLNNSYRRSRSSSSTATGRVTS